MVATTRRSRGAPSGDHPPTTCPICNRMCRSHLQSLQQSQPPSQAAAADSLEGDGIIASAYKLLTGRYPGERAVKQLLETHGERRIAAVNVVREPIKGIYRWLINVATGGRFEEAVQKAGHDQLWHLGVVIRLDNGLAFTLEKNQKVTVSPSKAYGRESQYRPVRVPAGLTLAALITNALRAAGRERFFVYDAFSTNCQQFIATILNANGMMTPELRRFVYQDVAAIAKDLGWWPHIFQAVTDAAAVITTEK